MGRAANVQQRVSRSGPVLSEFRSFLTKSNALALAIGVIVGAAMGKVVTALTNDILMPLIGLVLPKGDWREAQIVLSTATDATGKATINAIKYGTSRQPGRFCHHRIRRLHDHQGAHQARPGCAQQEVRILQGRPSPWMRRAAKRAPPPSPPKPPNRRCLDCPRRRPLGLLGVEGRRQEAAGRG